MIAGRTNNQHVDRFIGSDYLQGLDSVNATYLNVTSRIVDDEHSYFKDKPVKNDDKLKAMFGALFEGRKPESKMKYQPEINAYKLR